MSSLTEIKHLYITKLFENSEIGTSKFLPDSVLWRTNRLIIAELCFNEKGAKFYIYHRLWENIGNMFSLNYYEIEELVQEWVMNKHLLNEVSVRKDYIESNRWSTKVDNLIKSIENPFNDTEVLIAKLKDKHITINLNHPNRNVYYGNYN